MCLDNVASKEKLDAWKAKQGKYVKVYKICRNYRRRWLSRFDFAYLKFRAGWNKDKNEGILSVYCLPDIYPAGFHCYLSAGSALFKTEQWYESCITAYVPTKDVVAKGSQDRHRVIVSRRIYMPKYPETVAEKPK